MTKLLNITLTIHFKNEPVVDLSFLTPEQEKISAKTAELAAFVPEKIQRDNQTIRGELVRVKEYSPDLCEKMLDFFTSKEKFREVTETLVYKNGEVHEIAKLKSNAPPFVSEFARSIGVSSRTLKRWASEHEDFGEAFLMCKEIVAEFIVTHGLNGDYSSQFAIFAGKNFADLQDKTTVDVRNFNMRKFLDKVQENKGVSRDLEGI